MEQSVDKLAGELQNVILRISAEPASQGKDIVVKPGDE